MPFLRQSARRWHCFVGFDKALRAFSDSSCHLELEVLIFFEISSAVFSAPRFVLVKIRACFLLLIVSRARLIEGSDDKEGILRFFGIIMRKRRLFI